MTNTIQKLTNEIAENPTADLYYQRATQYCYIRKYDLAIQDCEKGLKLDKVHANCYYRRIYALSRAKRYEEALEDCNRSIELDPEYAPAYLGRGIVYLEQKKYEEALQEYSKTIELDPNNAPAYNNRGRSYYRENHYEEALEEYNKAIELDPDWAYPYNNRGRLYYKQKRYDKALEEYGKAIELKSDWASPYYNCGLIYYKQENYKEALENYKKAYDLYEEDNKYYKGEAGKRIVEITALLKSQKSEKDHVRIIIDETNEFIEEINRNEESQSDFFNHEHKIPPVANLEFTVLRKWNSFTPIVGSGFRASKGGGYFIKCGKTGIVIDPGFNFIENFMTNDYKFKEIDAVVITHAHNDHTSDLDSILTILHKYNEKLSKDIVEDIRRDLDYSWDMINSDPGKKKEVDEKVKKIYEDKQKVIKFYITSGTFKKYAGFFDLMKSSSYEIFCVDAEEFNNFKIDDINVRVIKAKHYDIISDETAVGFCFEYGQDFVLIYTGDTGFEEMAEDYRKLKEDYKGKRIALAANLGGFKDSENLYPIKQDNKNYFYKNHLGRVGMAMLVRILEPEICILSEFGEEFNGYRIKIAKVFNDVYKEHQKTTFLPADIGLRINSKMEVWAITESTTQSSPDEFTDIDGFPCGFIMPENVDFREVPQVSQLYYYNQKVDVVDLVMNKMNEFHKSLKEK